MLRCALALIFFPNAIVRLVFGSIPIFGGFLNSKGLVIMLMIGIVLIHASLGWFVGEHGTGGSEYSFILIVALMVVATDEKNKGAQ